MVETGLRLMFALLRMILTCAFGSLLFVYSSKAADVECGWRWDESWKKNDELNNFKRWWTPLGVEPKFGTCLKLNLKGPIEKGDYDKVWTVYKEGHPFLTEIELNSSGGRVDEAIKIGKLL